MKSLIYTGYPKFFQQPSRLILKVLSNAMCRLENEFYAWSFLSLFSDRRLDLKVGECSAL